MIAPAAIWHRFVGAFANTSPARGACRPTIGCTTHRCDCCGRDFLIIAAIADDGREVNVALPAIEALHFFDVATGLIAAATDRAAPAALPTLQ